MSWINENRLEIQTRAQPRILKYSLTGTSTVDDLIQLDEAIEAIAAEPKGFDGITNELIQAIVAEVVYECDSELLDYLASTAVEVIEEHITELSNGTHLLPHMMNTAEALIKNNDNVFFITSPVLVSVLQSIPTKTTIIKPKLEGGFRGPSNSIEIGSIDNIPLYSCIWKESVAFNNSNNVGAILVVGYNETAEALSSVVINVTSL